MKKYSSNEELQKSILKGAEKLYNYVSSTIGPYGKNVLIHLKNTNPITTKDGVTVARNITLEDEFENLGVQVLKEAAIKTEMTSGDGTSGTTILAYSIYKNALRYIFSGCNIYDLQRGIEKSVLQIVEKLVEHSQQIKSKDDIEKIATISANGDEIIGKIVSNAIDSIGKDGSIVVENSNTLETILNLVEGFRLPSGYASPYFVTDERKGFVKYESPLILVTDYKVDLLDSIMPVLEVVARESRPLIIVADQVEGMALEALKLNTIRGTLKVVAINGPKYGEEKRNILKDLALAVGSVFVSKETNIKLKDVKLQHLGTCKSVEIQKNISIFVDGKGNFEEIEKRIDILKNEILQTENMDSCKIIQQRITRLSSGIAIIRVGGSSEIEVQEKRFRIDDALEAVKSAQLEGISPGGGITLIRIAKELDVKTNNEDEKFGVEIIKRAIYEPFRKILLNANLNPEFILSQLEKEDFEMVFDVRKKKIINMKEGVIDPTKVLRCALQNATSVAISLITSNNAIVDGNDK